MRLLLALIAALAAFAILRDVIGALDIDPEVLARTPAPVLAAIIGVCGALITALVALAVWLTQEGYRRRQERDAEARRRRKVLVALRAEVSMFVAKMMENYAPAVAAELRAVYCQTVLNGDDGEHAMPVGLSLGVYPVFDQLKADLAELPDYAIRAVVACYQSDMFLNRMITGMTDGKFNGLSRERQLRTIDFYFDLGFDALRSAIKARCALTHAISPDGADSETWEGAGWRVYCTAEEKAALDSLDTRAPFAPGPAEMVRDMIVRPGA